MSVYLLLSDCFILIDAWHCEALITTASDENTIRPSRQILYLYSASKFAAPGDYFGDLAQAGVRLGRLPVKQNCGERARILSAQLTTCSCTILHCIWNALSAILLITFLVLWHCWLGVRKIIWPVKIEWWLVGVVICLERGADCLYMVQLMPLTSQTPSSLASINPDWFYLSGTGLPRLYRKRGH